MTRDEWKQVYRIARQPDKYLADDVVMAFPVRWLFWANECLDKRRYFA